MADWNLTPDWSDLSDIKSVKFEKKTGVTADMFNKIAENEQYLNNQKIEGALVNDIAVTINASHQLVITIDESMWEEEDGTILIHPKDGNLISIDDVDNLEVRLKALEQTASTIQNSYFLGDTFTLDTLTYYGVSPALPTGTEVSLATAVSVTGIDNAMEISRYAREVAYTETLVIAAQTNTIRLNMSKTGTKNCNVFVEGYIRYADGTYSETQFTSSIVQVGTTTTLFNLTYYVSGFTLEIDERFVFVVKAYNDGTGVTPTLTLNVDDETFSGIEYIVVAETSDYVEEAPEDNKLYVRSNGEWIDLSKYDLVIKTQAEFDTWLSDSDWNGAYNILLDGTAGAFVKSGVGGIRVPSNSSRDKYTITGINGAQIEITLTDLFSVDFGILIVTEQLELKDIYIKVSGSSDNVTALYSEDTNYVKVTDCTFNVYNAKTSSGAVTSAITLPDNVGYISNINLIVNKYSMATARIIKAGFVSNTQLTLSASSGTSGYYVSCTKGNNLYAVISNFGFTTPYIGSIDIDTCDFYSYPVVSVNFPADDWVSGVLSLAVTGLTEYHNPTINWGALTDEQFLAVTAAGIRAIHDGTNIELRALIAAPTIDLPLSIQLSK